MRVAAFDFELPGDRIADRPVAPRDRARLLVVRPHGLEDRSVTDLPGLLRAGDCLVVNDTKVIPARLAGRRGEARVEITLHRDEGGGRWRAFARPAKRLRPGDVVRFSDTFTCRVIARDGGQISLAFDRQGMALRSALDSHGVMPLPPYVRRPGGPDGRDAADYQTMFADRPGAVAAPTAGLHFTPRLVERLQAAGIGRATVTLHVGAGTFLPVRAADTDDHRMYGEWGEVTRAAADAINAARHDQGRIVAVGTTASRLLESAVDNDGTMRPFSGETGLFITPGHRFKAVDLLLTNFHLPRSTLFMLVAAFCGLDRMKAAYAHAIDSGYRFYSYGDACLLHPEPPG